MTQVSSPYADFFQGDGRLETIQDARQKRSNPLAEDRSQGWGTDPGITEA